VFKIDNILARCVSLTHVKNKVFVHFSDVRRMTCDDTGPTNSFGQQFALCQSQ
jgi:hypothetical protein